MKRLKANKHILHVLKNCRPKLRKVLLKASDPEVIKTLCEIALNTLNGNNKISKQCKLKLKKYKRVLRSLICPKLKLSSKRKILIKQKGGFLPVLIGTVLSGLIGQLINKTV